MSHTQEGRELTLEKPELKALVWEKLEELHRRWDELETTTQAKARSLFDANRAELFAQSCSALESWLESLQAQLHSDDYGKDLTSVNILLKKQQVRRGPRVGGGAAEARRGVSVALDSQGHCQASQAPSLVFLKAISTATGVRISRSACVRVKAGDRSHTLI